MRMRKISPSCVKMVEADYDSVVVSESEDSEETNSYPTTSCKDVESSNFDTGVSTFLS